MMIKPTSILLLRRSTSIDFCFHSDGVGIDLMKTVSGVILSSKPVSLSKASKILSKFSAVDNGASPAYAYYLNRASESFDELVQLHRELRVADSSKKHRSRIEEPLNYGEEKKKKKKQVIDNGKSDSVENGVGAENSVMNEESGIQKNKRIKESVDENRDEKKGRKKRKSEEIASTNDSAEKLMQHKKRKKRN